jgi:putative SOS response-associated peptidase YedK
MCGRVRLSSDFSEMKIKLKFDELYALLTPSPDETLKIWPVDNKVGNVRNTGPQLLRPIESEPMRLI